MDFDDDERDAPGFFSRLGGSCIGILVGIALMIASVPLLWWNEQRYITTWRVLDETSRLVVEAPCDRVMDHNFGQLIHVTCPLEAKGSVPRDSLGVQASNGTAVLARSAQLYQWEEDKDEREETDSQGHRKIKTTYSYSKIWADRHIDSSSFRYPDQCKVDGRRVDCHNPDWPDGVEDVQRVWAGTVDAGVFRLPVPMRDRIPADRAFTPALDAYTGSDGTEYNRVPGGLSSVAPGEPAVVGDVKIRYRVNSADTVSVVAAQAYAPRATATFAPYTSPKRRVFQPQIMMGELSAAEMFAKLHADNELLAWVLRVGGWLMCWLGMALCFQPLGVLASAVPLIGECVGEALTCALCCAAGAVSFSASLFMIAIAWLFCRPLFALPLLVLSTIPVVYLTWKRCSRDPYDLPAEGWSGVPTGPDEAFPYPQPQQWMAPNRSGGGGYYPPPGTQPPPAGYYQYPSALPTAPPVYRPSSPYPPQPSAPSGYPQQEGFDWQATGPTRV